MVSIRSNMGAMFSLQQIRANHAMTTKAMERVASGFRINRAADDAAGLSISERMRAMLGGMNEASSNVQDAVNMLNTAEGSLGVIQSMLQDMRGLSVRASSGIMTDTDRQMLNVEFKQLMEGVNQIAGSSSFNNIKLLDGGQVTFQIGPDAAEHNQLAFRMGDMSMSGMGIGDLDISTEAGARAAMGNLMSTINMVSLQRGGMGAQVNRLGYTFDNMQNSIENLMASESRIRDADIALEMMRYMQGNLLSQTSQTMLGKSFQQQQGILNLLV